MISKYIIVFNLYDQSMAFHNKCRLTCKRYVMYQLRTINKY